MVQDAQDPMAALFAIRHVRQDSGVFQRYRDLVVEPVVDPPLDLLAGAASAVHRDVKGMVDVIAALFRAQLPLEFFFAPRFP